MHGATTKFDLIVYNMRKTEEASACLNSLFEVLSIFNSNFNPETLTFSWFSCFSIAL